MQNKINIHMTSSRVIYLDILCIMAIFAVIMLHVASQYHYLDVSPIGYSIGVTYNTLGSIGEYAYHLWFLPMLIGVYVLIPILRAVVNAHLEKYYIILWLLVSCIMFLKPFATTLHLYPFYRVMEEMKIGVLYGYSGYFVLGYYLSNLRITKTYSILALGGFVGAWLLIAFGTHLLGNFKLYDYLTPLVIIMSVAVFVCIRYWFENSNNIALNNSISWIQSDLLGVYLIHAVLSESCSVCSVYNG